MEHPQFHQLQILQVFSWFFIASLIRCLWEFPTELITIVAQSFLNLHFPHFAQLHLPRSLDPHFLQFSPQEISTSPLTPTYLTPNKRHGLVLTVKTKVWQIFTRRTNFPFLSTVHWTESNFGKMKNVGKPEQSQNINTTVILFICFQAHISAYFV